jgi:hypothetical protein
MIVFVFDASSLVGRILLGASKSRYMAAHAAARILSSYVKRRGMLYVLSAAPLKPPEDHIGRGAGDRTTGKPIGPHPSNAACRTAHKPTQSKTSTPAGCVLDGGHRPCMTCGSTLSFRSTKTRPSEALSAVAQGYGRRHGGDQPQNFHRPGTGPLYTSSETRIGFGIIPRRAKVSATSCCSATIAGVIGKTEV